MLDEIYDSGVFLAENGISCPGMDELQTIVANLQGNNNLAEGCEDGFVYFTREGDLSLPMTVNYQISGTAANGIDYAVLPSSLNFAVGSDSTGFLIHVLPDSLPEGIEFLYIITSDSFCGGILYDTTVFTIHDGTEATFIYAGAYLNSPTQFADQTVSGGSAIVNWLWDFGDGATSSIQNPAHTYSSSGVFYVTLIVENTFGCRDTFMDTINIIQVGIDGVLDESRTVLFPNPARCVFTIGPISLYDNQPVRIEIIDQAGRVAWCGEPWMVHEKQLKFKPAGLKTRLYFVKMESGEKTVYFKLLWE